MDPTAVRWVLAPGETPVVLAYVAVGIVLGTASGLVPGLHANNVALLLAAVAADVPGPPLAVAAAMLAAGVVHTFLDVVPTLALGVPDAAMAATALPGHRLVLAGRGREALRLSALGSGLAVVFAVPLAVPVTAAMRVVYPTIGAHLSLVLGAVVVVLVATERTTRRRVGGVLATAASGALGLVTLDAGIAGPLGGGPLAPLFAGLFGAPVLVDAMDGGGVPPQDDPVVASSRRAVLVTAAVGTLSGAAVGYLPGVSSAVAAVLALGALPGAAGDRGYLVTTSGVNTAVTVFGLFALVSMGDARTGVLVALSSVDPPLVLPTLLGTVAVAAAVGFVLVLRVGDRYLALVGRVDARRLSVAVLGLLVVLSALFAGPAGPPVFVAAAGVGYVPVWFGARRVHLMSVLIVPLVVG